MTSHAFSLPESRPGLTPAFIDAAGASAWIAGLPQTQPFELLLAVLRQIEALDSSHLAATQKFALLCQLRSQIVQPQQALRARYLRKALPPSADDQRCFELAQRLWRTLGIALLRLVDELPSSERLRPLHYAASALRMAQYVHYLAAAELPVLLDRLLVAILVAAGREGLLGTPLDDPDFPHIEASTVGGQLSWAFLLRLSDPYSLSAMQLSVANRMFSRWRELVEFHSSQASQTESRTRIELDKRLAVALPADIPGTLRISRVLRKMHQRMGALSHGESPAALKLGSELSAAACLRLLHLLEKRLSSAGKTADSAADGPLRLSFGEAEVYALLSGKPLRPTEALGVNSASLAHQRIATFGFDRVDNLNTAVTRIEIPAEDWLVIEGFALRQPGSTLPRRQSPCLVGATIDGQPRLGVLDGLQWRSDGSLSAELRWLPAGSRCGVLTRGPRHALFLLPDQASAILPSSLGLRPDALIEVDGLPARSWRLGEVLERGSDFVRHEISAE